MNLEVVTLPSDGQCAAVHRRDGGVLHQPASTVVAEPSVHRVPLDRGIRARVLYVVHVVQNPGTGTDRSLDKPIGGRELRVRLVRAQVKQRGRRVTPRQGRTGCSWLSSTPRERVTASGTPGTESSETTKSHRSQMRDRQAIDDGCSSATN